MSVNSASHKNQWNILITLAYASVHLIYEQKIMVASFGVITIFSSSSRVFNLQYLPKWYQERQ